MGPEKPQAQVISPGPVVFTLNWAHVNGVLDVSMVKGKARDPHQIDVKFSAPVFSHQWNSAFLSYPIFTISLPVCDIYQTQVCCRARKDSCDIIPCRVVLTAITVQKFTSNVELPFSRKVDYGIMFVFYP